MLAKMATHKVLGSGRHGGASGAGYTCTQIFIIKRWAPEGARRYLKTSKNYYTKTQPAAATAALAG